MLNTRQIKSIYKVAEGEGTLELLEWLIDEQKEEEEKFTDLLFVCNIVGVGGLNNYLIKNESP